ncbi:MULTISPECIES: AraC family transcriptional regulator [Bradyrhizobium]|uniref:AraC family transcriptional regulator n=1 Tax=Bradyrhizobium TaxID=374 RepID=UPI0011440D39|nr:MULTISPECIES: AraC family transcriptional regulator [Bradyrhizobium]QOG22708.1 helix-turn-helix domain-containing protein [Bradyrhizobium sp. SEMIA]UFW50252.1 AraC family transcriptional regulator [Bradyrhizobium arachidis]
MQRIIFDSSALAGEERSRKDLWISTLSSGYVRLNADPAANRPFQGQLKIAVIDKTSVGTIYGTVKTIARSAREVAAENTDNVVLLCNSGTRRICIEQKGVAIDLDAGDPVLIEQCAPSWIRVDHANCNLLAIQAPRAHVAALLPELNDRFMLRAPARSTAMALMNAYVSVLLSPQEPAGPLALRFASRHIADFIAAAVEPAAAHTSQEHDGLRAGRMAAIYRALEQHAAEADFSLPVLGRRLGITPRYVQRLLAEMGTSFTEEVTRRRLNRARDMLISPRYRRLNVTDIALECGFSTVSHFHRLFQREFGTTPGALRSVALNRDE